MAELVAAIISEIASVRMGSRVRIIFLDGEEWRMTAAPVVRQLGIREGDVVDERALSDAFKVAERAAARERALALLGYRERSVAELRRRMLDDGYPVPIVATIVEDFERLGLVDDVRFAEMYTRSLCVGKGLGRRRVERELAERGVTPEVAAVALAQYCEIDDEPERARVAAFHLVRASDRVKLLAARLVRKGYAPGHAFTAAREALAAKEAEASGEDPG